MMKLVASAALLLALFVAASESAACTNNWANTLLPCLSATNSATGTPPQQCCTNLVNTYLRRDPSCLCNDMLTARQAFSFNIQNALSIPSRCGYANQVPRGYKCGNYVVGH